MPVEMDRATFEAHVVEAIDQIPDELARLVVNCVILVEDDPPADQPADLLGLYEGTPITERYGDGVVYPDRILIFRNPTLAVCETTLDVVDEVNITVVHEIAHYFGIDDDHLHELGYG
jgi:predicted Zn-dependent protease with MMP-like domain